ncbi:MAG: nucleotidyltransferase family protein [Anaerolineae bacterium]|nr:nucleotidyltransferase family protein [Anaerolineae bacterium]
MIQWPIVNVNEPSSPVAAVVLAAGGSSRMGELKQLLPVDGRPMVRRAVEAACDAGLAQVVVVVGAGAPAVTTALEGLDVDVVRNDDWAEGMSTSLRAGLAALAPEIGATFVVLADQPGLSGNLLRRLVSRYKASGAPIVVPYYGGQRGNPVLFGRRFFAELARVEGDRGGRVILARHGDEVEAVDVDDVAVVRDVDTRQDYAAIVEEE